MIHPGGFAARWSLVAKLSLPTMPLPPSKPAWVCWSRPSGTLLEFKAVVTCSSCVGINFKQLKCHKVSWKKVFRAKV